MRESQILKSETIIPPHLYVERGADTQLRQVIDAMGRPAYVLVSRQMGKTNLLLHAKRCFRCDGDVFVYLDASNVFDTLSEFFRNIIDTAIQTHRDILAPSYTLIQQSRDTFKDMAPHMEHENELLTLLKAIPGRLVIFIDEVDALASAPYRDNAFSYIRSIYFSGRTNFPELHRLTYVLSGVAEPTELIKNRAISPFNIGEKIYLEDFTRDEFGVFISQAGLYFPTTLIDRIFYWTNGNPRLSWDVSSAVENLIREGGTISDVQVDNLINSMYLTKFDLPPVDHMRKLVAAEPVIRDAMMSIHWGKGKTLDSSLGNRLYLAGLINIKEDGNLEIKNRIVSEAISEKWLRDTEKGSMSFLRMADSAYAEARYDDAFELYEQFTLTSQKSAKDADIKYMQGLCKYGSGDYETAAQLFSQASFDKNNSVQRYYSNTYQLANCLYQLGRNDESLRYYEIIFEQKGNKQLFLYFEALVNASSIWLENPDDFSELVKSANEEVTSSVEEIRSYCGDDQDGVGGILGAAYLNLSLLYAAQLNLSAAHENIEQALKWANDRTIVGLYIHKARLEVGTPREYDVAAACAAEILKRNLRLQKTGVIYPLGFSVDNCVYLLAVLGASSDGLESQFKKYIRQILSDASIYDYSTLFSRAGNLALSKGSLVKAANLLEEAFISSSEDSVSNRRLDAVLAILIGNGPSKNKLNDLYYSRFWKDHTCELVDSDFRVGYGMVIDCISTGELKKARSIVERFKQLTPKFLHTQNQTGKPAIGAAIDALLGLMEMETAIAEGDYHSAGNAIPTLLKTIHGIKSGASILHFHGDIRSQMLKRVAEARKGLTTAGFISKQPRFGRNQIVTVTDISNGKKSSGKYKNFESRITSGQLKVIS